MNDNRKIYVISNSNTRTLNQESLRRQEMMQRRENNNKTFISIILVMIVAICIILLFYLLDGLGNKAISDITTTVPVTLNANTTTSSEKIVYTPTSTVQPEATHTYSR